MSKLYATLSAPETSKVVSKSSNMVLTVHLFKGNSDIGILTMNEYNNEIVFSRRDGNGYTPLFRTEIEPKRECRHNLDSYGKCCNCGDWVTN